MIFEHNMLGLQKKIMRKATLYILTIFSILSCSRNKLIPEKDFVDILVKIYLADASVTAPPYRIKYFAKDTIEYYAPIIESFGFSQAAFDSTISYYSRKPKEFDAVFDKVIIELSKYETEIIAKSDNPDDLELVDTSKNLWPHKTSWNLEDDFTSNPTMGFDIPVKGFGVYTLSADIQMFPDDETTDTRISALFWYDDKSQAGNYSQVVNKYIIKDGVTRNYTISLELRNPLVTHFKGWLLDQNNKTPNFKKHAFYSNISIKYKPFDKPHLLKPKKPGDAIKEDIR